MPPAVVPVRLVPRVMTRLRGTATSATLLTLSDTLASFHSTQVGCPLWIVSGRGAGQARIIASVTATKLTLARPWLILPDTTSVYQVGGISWRFRTRWFRYRDDDKEQARRLELTFEPCVQPSQVEAKLYQDRDDVAVLQGSTGELNGWTSVQGAPELVGDLTRVIGYLQRRLDGFKDLYADGPRFLQVELSGVANQEPVRLYELVIDGVK